MSNDNRRRIRALANKPRPAMLYHATTPKKLARYRATGTILTPVRGFDTEQACREWARLHGPRTVIVEIPAAALPVHPLPDHHRDSGHAWWVSVDVKHYRVLGRGAEPVNGRNSSCLRARLGPLWQWEPDSAGEVFTVSRGRLSVKVSAGIKIGPYGAYAVALAMHVAITNNARGPHMIEVTKHYRNEKPLYTRTPVQVFSGEHLYSADHRSWYTAKLVPLNLDNHAIG